MKKKKPHQQLTIQDNQLTSTQEVLYQKDFKLADQKDTQTNEQQYNKNEKKYNM